VKLVLVIVLLLCALLSVEVGKWFSPDQSAPEKTKWPDQHFPFLTIAFCAPQASCLRVERSNEV